MSNANNSTETRLSAVEQSCQALHGRLDAIETEIHPKSEPHTYTISDFPEIRLVLLFLLVIGLFWLLGEAVGWISHTMTTFPTTSRSQILREVRYNYCNGVNLEIAHDGTVEHAFIAPSIRSGEFEEVVKHFLDIREQSIKFNEIGRNCTLTIKAK
ncbi:hypothetical protein [Ralstonia mannitolilytica]|uniref:hypothetical protein n=1 Tax=Ralstonia mannitolilytica TaxID=105219 RepID=UPI001C9430EF|nr:hypothetical protein [Ralstonia mannitolilytica]MBY4717575.1 hypothetical protein [Ralstonia mannitolilytica]